MGTGLLGSTRGLEEAAEEQKRMAGGRKSTQRQKQGREKGGEEQEITKGVQHCQFVPEVYRNRIKLRVYLQADTEQGDIKRRDGWEGRGQNRHRVFLPVDRGDLLTLCRLCEPCKFLVPLLFKSLVALGRPQLTGEGRGGGKKNSQKCYVASRLQIIKRLHCPELLG